MTTNSDAPPEEERPESPQWSSTAKLIVVLGVVVFAFLVMYRFQNLFGQIIVAGMLAYLLHPVITWIDERAVFLGRSAVVLLVYLMVVLILLGTTTALGVAAVRQVSNLINTLPAFITDLTDTFDQLSQQTVTIGPWSVDLDMTGFDLNWTSVQEELLSMVQPAVTRLGGVVGQVASGTVSLIGVGFFVLVVSIYLANDIPKLSGYIATIAHQPGYRRDAERLMREFGRIWSSYLRGQLILGLVIAVMVGVSLGVAGVQNAVALGLLSGLLEFVPVLGPIVGTFAAMIVAFFQPDNYLGLSSFNFMLVTLVIMIVIQQIENNILVPRIVGESLELHPLLVMIGVFMGASAAGIIGAILAAPIIATIKLLAIYAWRKLFDLPPFSRPEKESSEPLLPTLIRHVRQLGRRLQDESPPEPVEPPADAETETGS